MIPIPPWLWGFLVNRYTVGGVIGLGLLAGAYFKGYWAAREACQDNALKAQLAAMQRDMDAWRAADRVEAMLQAETEADNRELERKVQTYERELSSRQEPICLLSPDDIRSLDGLRNGRK